MAKNASEYVVEEDSFDINDRPQTSADSPVSQSWDSPAMAAPKSYATDFKFTDEIQIVRFHESFLPPVSFKQHWLGSKTSGKRSYVCINPKGRPDLSCPLCKMPDEVPGQFAKSKWAFTVANFSSDPFQQQLMIGAKRLFDVVWAMDKNENLGPISGKYWAVSKSGDRQNIAYHIAPVKERDLKEDWGIDPKAAKEFFESMEAYPKSIIKCHTASELQEIAESLY